MAGRKNSPKTKPTTLRLSSDAWDAIKFIRDNSVVAKSTVGVIRGALAKYQELLEMQLSAAAHGGRLVVVYRGKQIEEEGSHLSQEHVLDFRL